MERSCTMENKEIGNGTVPHRGKYGNREWSGPAQWKIWNFGNGTVPNNEKMGIGNGTVPHNEENGIREWNNPEQWKKWDTGMERSRTMKNRNWDWNGPEQ